MNTSILSRHRTMFLSGQYTEYQQYSHILLLIYAIEKRLFVTAVYRIATEHHLYNEPLKTSLLYFMRIQMQLILFKLSIGVYGNFLFAS
ncbi:hypothetical protein BDF19DRAFT_445594 [Syncephalis fuscata]|nr:hypothetical protein BDF19DRAFT_445594 [Syncephalis fuscata]